MGYHFIIIVENHWENRKWYELFTFPLKKRKEVKRQRVAI
jgi:hypothetical protein